MLLSLVTLPVVVGMSLLIYHYMRFGVMVERRLQGERWMVPSRVYARPLVLRPGLPLRPARPREDPERPQVRAARRGRPGPRAVRGRRERRHLPSRGPSPDAADEPVIVAFEKDQVKELRGAQTKKKYPHADPRARARHLPLRRVAREAAARPLRGAARAPHQGGARHRGPPLLLATPGSTPSASRGRRSGTSRPRATSRAAAPSPSSCARTSSSPPSARSGASCRRRCSPSCSSGAPTRRTSSSST